ncbi:dihydrofolate reductase [Naumannella sp. ID2617S]|uniref:Deaminase n=1 Tax=Enemella dayhoffiae TaxID=2016507 RepID=A0A255HFQ2_9ACTN|nr:dihydrofolate reductase family protein [Enemella dayhoffiae]NNG20099.1 dihydrofolate reductase [Naumannella sp. ID2617S]OYO25304.1 deaminase [Enemella dayhoffiae]
MRSLIYLIAVSLDGYIADAAGEWSSFDSSPELLADLFTEYPETCPVQAREALGVTAPPRHFDTVIMGARTHRPALDAGLTSAYPHLRQYVVTHRTDLPNDPTLRTTTDPVGLVRELKSQPGKNLWLCGGGDLAGQLVDEIDEFHLKVNPVLLGSGTPLLAGVNARVGVRETARQRLGERVDLVTLVSERPAGPHAGGSHAP